MGVGPGESTPAAPPSLNHRGFPDPSAAPSRPKVGNAGLRLHQAPGGWPPRRGKGLCSLFAGQPLSSKPPIQPVPGSRKQCPPLSSGRSPGTRRCRETPVAAGAEERTGWTTEGEPRGELHQPSRERGDGGGHSSPTPILHHFALGRLQACHQAFLLVQNSVLGLSAAIFQRMLRPLPNQSNFPDCGFI